MQATYEFWLTSDKGLRLAQLTNILDFTGTRVTNGIARFSAVLPGNFDDALLKPDCMLQVWRSTQNKALKLYRVYILRKWIFEQQGDVERITLAGPDVCDLLRRRVVAGFLGSTSAKKTGKADNLMKAYVRDSLSNSNPPTPTSGTRLWPNLTVEPDTSQGPDVVRDLPFHKLLTTSNNGVLAVLAKASKEAGSEVYFDIEPSVLTSDTISFIFRTKVGQPGIDVSDSVVFDVDNGNLLQPKLEIDHSEEENYIYAVGLGEGNTRKVVQVYDVGRYSTSIWGRCEGYADAQESTAAALGDAGRTVLADGRPKIRFSAIPSDTEGTKFGVHWDYGYKVKAKYRGFAMDCIIRTVTLNVTANVEHIQARLDYTS